MLGPMVMAAVALTPKAAEELAALGVTDSKRFGAGEKAHHKRQALVSEITSRALHVEVAVVSSSGTGLGLALARDLAEQNYGRLELLEAAPAVFALFLSDAESSSLAKTNLR